MSHVAFSKWLKLKAVVGCQLPKPGTFTVTLKILLYVKTPWAYCDVCSEIKEILLNFS